MPLTDDHVTFDNSGSDADRIIADLLDPAVGVGSREQFAHGARELFTRCWLGGEPGGRSWWGPTR